MFAIILDLLLTPLIRAVKLHVQLLEMVNAVGTKPLNPSTGEGGDCYWPPAFSFDLGNDRGKEYMENVLGRKHREHEMP